MRQRCYKGVFLLGDGPCLSNVQRLDHFARPYTLECMRIGMMVDPSHFATIERGLAEEMEKTVEEIRGLTGKLINPGSGPQVSHLLFKELGLKQLKPKMTRSGARESVENEVLISLQHEHPVVGKLLVYKELEKLLGTYARPLQRLAKRDAFGVWRIFPQLGDTRVPSGRNNCKEPNLLAMPNKTEWAAKLMDGFIVPEGWVLVSVDESQIEPRVCAHRSGDAALTAVYENEEDIYSDFAIAAFRIPDKRYQDAEGWHYPGVDKKRQRFPSKTCVLASIYEVTALGLLEQMPVVCAHCEVESAQHNNQTCPKFESLWTEAKCQDLINAFGLKYSGVLQMRARDHSRARRYGYLWDDWGRLLHVVAVRSVLSWVVSAALREAGNFPIQSTARGTVKLTAAQVEDDRQAMGLTEVVSPQLDIHDELLFACREDVAEEWADHVKYRFENCVRLNIPIKAGSAMSKTWGSMPK